MRILILHWTTRAYGGAENYLDTVVPLLRRRGHEVAVVAELSAPVRADEIPSLSSGKHWVVEALGAASAIRSVEEWRPDVVYSHITFDVEFESRILRIAPGVRFAHGYHGTCISGTKTHQFPGTVVCHRPFGPACLGYYFPRRCGGLNPLVMLRSYGEQRKRLDLLDRYRLVLTGSEHMRREYVSQGLPNKRVRKVTMPIRPRIDQRSDPAARRDEEPAVAKLLFAGRMEPLKGGETLIRALPSVAEALGRQVRMTFAGEGGERAAWEATAREVSAENRKLTVEFTGRIAGGELARLYAGSDLLVVPSLWPEPFGMVGPEAGRFALPAAGFAVGGIPEWLHDGVNGHLAQQCTPEALAGAIVKCLADREHHGSLRQGAVAAASQFSPDRHVDELEGLFLEVEAEGRKVGPAGAGPTNHLQEAAGE